jgi:poly-gamma-glutamate synthesis protein (capsule biosynthesis protein)
MSTSPLAHVRRAADVLVAAGATLIAGHSAHVVHGMRDRVLYDLGDFIDDYAVDRRLRNDLGLLFLVELDAHRARQVQALPLKLDFCHTRLAEGDDAAWIRRRFTEACAEMGTGVAQLDDRLVVQA